MSNALQTSALLDAIRAAILVAWGNIPITFGPPRLASGVSLFEQAPYCEVIWEGVQVSFSGYAASVGGPSQTNSFRIHGTFPFPSDTTQPVDLLKVTNANLLIAQLQTAANFAGIGLKPLVTDIDPTDHHSTTENVFDLTLTFVVITTSTHH